jgi:hypothetical protein
VNSATGAARPPRPPGLLERQEHTNAPRLALRKPEAAAALGMSDETFDRYVRPTLAVVRAGTVRVYPVAALVAWLDDNARAPVDELEASS